MSCFLYSDISRSQEAENQDAEFSSVQSSSTGARFDVSDLLAHAWMMQLAAQESPFRPGATIFDAGNSSFFSPAWESYHDLPSLERRADRMADDLIAFLGAEGETLQVSGTQGAAFNLRGDSAEIERVRQMLAWMRGTLQAEVRVEVYATPTLIPTERALLSADEAERMKATSQLEAWVQGAPLELLSSVDMRVRTDPQGNEDGGGMVVAGGFAPLSPAQGKTISYGDAWRLRILPLTDGSVIVAGYYGSLERGESREHNFAGQSFSSAPTKMDYLPFWIRCNPGAFAALGEDARGRGLYLRVASERAGVSPKIAGLPTAAIDLAPLLIPASRTTPALGVEGGTPLAPNGFPKGHAAPDEARGWHEDTDLPPLSPLEAELEAAADAAMDLLDASEEWRGYRFGHWLLVRTSSEATLEKASFDLAVTELRDALERELDATQVELSLRLLRLETSNEESTAILSAILDNANPLQSHLEGIPREGDLLQATLQVPLGGVAERGKLTLHDLVSATPSVAADIVGYVPQIHFLASGQAFSIRALALRDSRLTLDLFACVARVLLEERERRELQGYSLASPEGLPLGRAYVEVMTQDLHPLRLRTTLQQDSCAYALAKDGDQGWIVIEVRRINPND